MGVNTFNELFLDAETENGKKLIKHFYDLMQPDRDLADDYFNGTATTMKELEEEFKSIMYDDLDYEKDSLHFTYWTRGLAQDWIKFLDTIEDISVCLYYRNEEQNIQGQFDGNGFTEEEFEDSDDEDSDDEDDCSSIDT